MNGLLLPCPFFFTLLCIALAGSPGQWEDLLKSFIKRDPQDPTKIEFELPLPSSTSQFPRRRLTVIKRREFSSDETNSPALTLHTLDSEVSNFESENNSTSSTFTPTSGSSEKPIQEVADNPYQEEPCASWKKFGPGPHFPRCATVRVMMERWPEFTIRLEELQKSGDSNLKCNEMSKYYKVARGFRNLYEVMGESQFIHEFGKIQTRPYAKLAFPLRTFARQKCGEWKIEPWGMKEEGSGVDEWKQFLTRYKPKSLRNKASCNPDHRHENNN